MSESERAKMVKESVNQVIADESLELKHYFDNYIRALALNKQLFSLENVDEEPNQPNDESLEEQKVPIEGGVEVGNSYFITQKNEFI